MGKNSCSKWNDHSGKTCTPLIRNGFSEVYSICNGDTHTLLESVVFPMRNVTAELDNFGCCPVTYHFLTKKGQTIDKTVQPGQEITVQIPGRIIMVTATCECTSCAPGPCAPSPSPVPCPPSPVPCGNGGPPQSPEQPIKAAVNGNGGGYYAFCGFDIYVEYTQCVCCRN